MYNYLIKNGTLFLNGKLSETPLDIGISGSRIVKIGSIPETVFGDRVGETITGNTLLKNMMTFRNGLPVYRDQQF